MCALWKEFRKFGLQCCDLPTMLSNLSVLLRVLSVNIDSNYKKGIPVYYYLITILTAACNLYVYLFSVLWFVFCRCTVTGDLLSAMIVFSLGVSSEIGNFKFVYMCLHIDKLKKIADEYLKCDSQTVPGSRFNNNLLAALRKVKKRAIINWIVLIGNGILYLLLPILTPGRRLPEDLLIIYGLDPMLESPNYEIAWIMMTACVFFICYVPANVSAYFIVIAGYAESQMLALSAELLHIWPDALKQVQEARKLQEFDHAQAHNNRLLNKYVKNKLKDLIARHAFIIKTFQKVEDVFRGAIVMGFILLIIGLIAELLGKLENTYLQMPFALTQVAMDCFIGQRVMDASDIFEQAVYDCGWENFDKTNMKMVLVMLQNSQKTMTLSAGGIATLSFCCLMSITRGIYSTYTTLRSTVK